MPGHLAHHDPRYARGIDEQRQDELEAILTDDVELLTLPWSQHAGVGKDTVLEASVPISGRSITRGASSPTNRFMSTTMERLLGMRMYLWYRRMTGNRTVDGAIMSGSFAMWMRCGRLGR
jgi:hypothetical protein